MTEILPNPYIEKFNTEKISIHKIDTLKETEPILKIRRVSREDIKKIVVSWFNKEAKHKIFHLDELIDALYGLVSK